MDHSDFSPEKGVREAVSGQGTGDGFFCDSLPQHIKSDGKWDGRDIISPIR